MLSLGFGAGEESRTLDLNLGKVALYQLSYSRKKPRILPTNCALSTCCAFISSSHQRGSAMRLDRLQQLAENLRRAADDVASGEVVGLAG